MEERSLQILRCQGNVMMCRWGVAKDRTIAEKGLS